MLKYVHIKYEESRKIKRWHERTHDFCYVEVTRYAKFFLDKANDSLILGL